MLDARVSLMVKRPLAAVSVIVIETRPVASTSPRAERDEYYQAIWLPRAIRGSVPPASRRSPGAVHSREGDGTAIERRGLKGSAFHRGGDLRDERPLARITHQDVHGHCAGGTWRNIDPHCLHG